MTRKCIPIDNELFIYVIGLDLKANQRMIEYVERQIEREKDFILRQLFREDLKQLKAQRQETLTQFN